MSLPLFVFRFLVDVRWFLVYTLVRYERNDTVSTTIMQYNPQIVNDLIGRIVNAVHPIRIILFGSAARGEMEPDSDIDIMVVMPDGTHRLNTTRYLYRRILGFGFPVDIIVVTPSILERHKNNIGLIYRTVLAEGREVYVT